ncbi:RNA polymerase sigma factor [Negadavirga shengliensis]|uniref:RNA polymerase sigma factor n=1 Tax=Negadavirga shengliensis TaxID=1389218 RepID=A0ABV9T2S7_9BACT
MDFANCSDSELWRLITYGNREVFQHLYETYYDGLYFYGMHITQDEDRVKDTIQDLFVRLWTNKKQIDIRHSMKFYLFSAFRRNLLKQLKKDTLKVDSSVLNNVSQSQNFMDVWMMEEKNQSTALYLQKYINQLSPRHKEIVHLKFFEGLNYSEISSLTGLDQQYLYNIINKVSGLLRAQIDKKKLSEL